LGVMVVIWGIMHREGGGYLTVVDTITDQARRNEDDPSALETFRMDLKARQEPEIMAAVSMIGGLVILWLMMFKPF